MENLIAIMQGNDMLGVVSGEWADRASWTLARVKVYAPHIVPYEPVLKAAIFKNTFGVPVVGGLIPENVEHFWEGVKKAVQAFCEAYGFEYRLYIKDPEYTAYPPEGAVQ